MSMLSALRETRVFRAMLTALTGNTKRVRLLVIAASGAIVLLVLIGLANGSRSWHAQQGESSASLLYNTETLRTMVLPGPALGEPLFPLAFERKSRYTLEDVARNAPLYEGVNLDTLEQNRKAQLDTLFQSVD